MTDKPIERKDVERLVELGHRPGTEPTFQEYQLLCSTLVQELAEDWLSMDERIRQAEAKADLGFIGRLNDRLVELENKLIRAETRGRESMREQAARSHPKNPYIELRDCLESEAYDLACLHFERAIRALPLELATEKDKA